MQTSQAESADLGSVFVFYILMNNPRSTFYSIVWDNTHRQSLPQCFSCSHSAVSSFMSSRWCRFLSVSSTSQSFLCLWLACYVSAGFYSTIDWCNSICTSIYNLLYIARELYLNPLIESTSRSQKKYCSWWSGFIKQFGLCFYPG